MDPSSMFVSTWPLFLGLALWVGAVALIVLIVSALRRTARALEGIEAAVQRIASEPGP